MKLTLAAAGFYNLIWGALIIVNPALVFDWAGMAQPNYPELWQASGLLIGIFGLGYWIASGDPLRHWPITFLGLLGKVLAPVGIAKAVYEKRFTPEFLWFTIPNDVIWWIPFALILLTAYRQSNEALRLTSPEIQSWAMRAQSQFGISILDHSRVRPVLLVFLRHVGCTFCREALGDLSAQRREIEATGSQLVLVHMGREEAAEQILAKYKLQDIPRVADSKLALYNAFGLEHGNFGQLFGPKVWLRGFKVGLLGQHGIGSAEGDVTQMPGVFLVFHGEILKAYRHRSAADRPDYLAMVRDIAGVPDTRSR